MDDDVVVYMLLHLVTFAVTIYCSSQLGTGLMDIDIETASDAVNFILMFSYPAFIVLSAGKDYLSKRNERFSRGDVL
jgi:hypothetical protein